MTSSVTSSCRISVTVQGCLLSMRFIASATGGTTFARTTAESAACSNDSRVQRQSSAAPLPPTTALVADVEAQFGSGITTVRGPLARDGLRLEVHTDKRRPDSRLAWLADNIPLLPGAGIVYCLTRRSVFQVAEFLEARGAFPAVSTLGAAIRTKSRAPRSRTSIDFFPTTFDASSPRPPSEWDTTNPTSDGLFTSRCHKAPSPTTSRSAAPTGLDRSYGILFAGVEDRDIQDWFIKQAFPSAADVECILSELAGSDDGLTRSEIAQRTNLTPTRLDGFMVQLQVERGCGERRGAAGGAHLHRGPTLMSESPPSTSGDELSRPQWGATSKATNVGWPSCVVNSMTYPQKNAKSAMSAVTSASGSRLSPDLVHEASESLQGVRPDRTAQTMAGRDAVGRNDPPGQANTGRVVSHPVWRIRLGAAHSARKQQDHRFSDELLDPMVEMIRTMVDPNRNSSPCSL